MKVLDAFMELQKLVNEGYENLDLVCIDTRSGVSDRLDLYGSVSINNQKCDGFLSDQNESYQYVACYIG